MTHNQKIILQGGGEHARVVLDCLLDSGMDVLAIYDPAYQGELFGVPQKGVYNPEANRAALTIVAIGDNHVRKKVSASSKHNFANAIHRSAIISRYAFLGEGNMILHRAVVQAQSKIGNHVIINTGAQVDHDCVIGDFVHLAPGAILCGTVTVGEGAFIGAGAIVIPGKRIGAWAVVGAGAVVTRDIPDHAVARGNPARVAKYTKHE